MSWTCPNLSFKNYEDFCLLRRKKCEPMAKGCVIKSKGKKVDLSKFFVSEKNEEKLEDKKNVRENKK